MKKTIATIFTGGGLFDIGAQQAGYEHIWGIELDPKIAAVANLNGLHTLAGDVREVGNYADLASPDHFHASPPCPSFSVAKSNGGETPLDIELADAVCWFIVTKKPKTVSIENVVAYRKSESFRRIISCLEENGYMTDVQILNSADFGVPQTRKRLIVRASKNLLHPYRQPTKWIGWYKAIEDIIHTLPDSQFAPWQVARLPKEYKEFMIGNGQWSKPLEPSQPTGTITTNRNQEYLRAFIAAGGSAGKNMPVVNSEEPVFTIKSNAGGREPVRAFLFNGAGNSSFADAQEGKGIRWQHEPAHTQTVSSIDGKQRAFVGRVVKMTVQALGRFQTVPDDYKGLTTKINGNGVPCKLAQAIMESF